MRGRGQRRGLMEGEAKAGVQAESGVSLQRTMQKRVKGNGMGATGGKWCEVLMVFRTSDWTGGTCSVGVTGSGPAEARAESQSSFGGGALSNYCQRRRGLGNNVPAKQPHQNDSFGNYSTSLPRRKPHHITAWRKAPPTPATMPSRTRKSPRPSAPPTSLPHAQSQMP
jgi:hypothetical protein